MKHLALLAALALPIACSHVTPYVQPSVNCAESDIAPLVPQFIADLASEGWIAALETDGLRYGRDVAECVYAYIVAHPEAKGSTSVVVARAEEGAKHQQAMRAAKAAK